MSENIVPATSSLGIGARESLLQRLGRRVFLAKLGQLRHGEITVVEGGEHRTFGQRTGDCSLHATIEVLHPQTYADAAFGGTVGGGEAFMRGYPRSDDLTSLIRLFIANRDVMETMEGGAAIATTPLRRVLHWLNRNSHGGSRRNIAAHYDLGNDLFALFLDETISYSCGSSSATTRRSRGADRQVRAPLPQAGPLPSDHLLEIGTGWGGLAIHAATRYGCRVTTTTISASSMTWPPNACARRACPTA